MNKELEAKIRKAHKVYTNEDGVQMCEMEFSKYLEMERALEERDIYFKALCDIESGENVRKVLERTLS